MKQEIKKLIRDVRNFKIAFDDIPNSAWDDDDFSDDILGLYPRGYTYIEKRKNFNKNQLIHYINEINAPGIYKYLSPNAKKDEDIIYQVIPWCVEDVPKKYLSEDKFIKRILVGKPLALSQLSNDIKGNKEYVKIAVENNGLALIHASSILRSDLELIMIALVYSKDTNCIVIDHLGEKLKNDSSLLLDLVIQLKSNDEEFEENMESIFEVLEPTISKELKEKMKK